MNQTKAHYKSKKIIRILAAMIAAILLAGLFPMTEAAWAESDGMIRVKLTRLGSAPTSITMTTVGKYSVGGQAISSGSTVRVSLTNGKLTLTAGGTQLASGTKITMSRASGGTGTGVRFTSPSLSNLFCGDLNFSVSGNGIQTVLSIYIETYLYGVVPYEMSNSFPIEALKAQAISARTYAMRAKKSSGSYDVTDNTSSQAFKGYNSSYANAIAAVDGTKGVVLMTSGGSYAQCYYTASNGGQTESTANAWGSSGVSYLTVKDDPYDRENPNSIVKSYSISKDPNQKPMLETLKRALIEAAAEQLTEKGLSTEEDDVVIERIIGVELHTPKFDPPSRTYTKLRFTMELTGKSQTTGNKVTTQVEVNLGTYSKLQSMLSLSINSSDNEIISIEEKEDSFVLSFARYGHGIGLSQRGAQWMAKEYGKSYEEILEFYYPGTVQTRLSLKETIVGTGASEPTPAPSRAPVSSEDGYTTLQEGDSGSEVKKLQTRLKELGYFTGTPLGNYKTLTVSAVKAYQKAMGLEADGVATPELQKMIFAQTQETVQPTQTPAPEQEPEQKPAEGETSAKVQLSSSSSTLNVRKEPSTSAGIAGTLRHGAQVEVLAVSGDWRKIKSGSLTGYVMAKYLKFDGNEPEGTNKPENGNGYVTLQYGDSGEAVRELQIKLAELGFFTGTPLGNYKTLTSSAVQSYQKAMGLTADGVATPELQEMIFAGKLPETQATPQPTVQPTATPEPENEGVQARVSLGNASSRLNVRKSASTSAGIAGTLAHGAKVTVLETSGSWSRIRSGNLTGYVMSSFLVSENGALPTVTPKPTEEPEGQTGVAVIKLRSASSKLNVRREATTASSVVGVLRHGTKVEVLGESGEWSRIRSGSLTGYVMTSYLSKDAEVSEPDPKPTDQPSSDANAAEYRTLSYGDSGTAVKQLQTRLKELGYFDGQLGGNYLKLTKAAVEAYQEANGWNVDGVATPDLQKEIFEKNNVNTSDNATVTVGSDSYLNLRKSANSASSVVGRMKNGTRVYVMGSDGDWYQVKVSNGLTGYAKKEYIRMD